MINHFSQLKGILILFSLFCRLGLDTQSTISFENFVTHFQDGEVGTKNYTL